MPIPTTRVIPRAMFEIKSEISHKTKAKHKIGTIYFAVSKTTPLIVRKKPTPTKATMIAMQAKIIPKPNKAIRISINTP